MIVIFVAIIGFVGCLVILLTEINKLILVINSVLDSLIKLIDVWKKFRRKTSKQKNRH